MRVKARTALGSCERASYELEKFGKASDAKSGVSPRHPLIAIMHRREGSRMSVCLDTCDR